MPKPFFSWCEDTGTAVCIIDNKFQGFAQCHEDDEDMKSEKVGYNLAYNRALLKLLKHKRNNEIKPSLKALKQLYYSMKHSSRFNEHSYEAIMLNRQIRNWEIDLEGIEDAINFLQKHIDQYIADKEIFYQKIRKIRQADKNQ